jgi:ABC-type transport system substrate-binding protein
VLPLKSFTALVIVGAMATPIFAGGTTVRFADVFCPVALDPARLPDVYSQAIAGTLFDQLYTYDYLARPLRLRPLAASGMPRVSADGRDITVSIRHGIWFTAHRAFGGAPRELTAEDFVYSVKRFMDPAVRSPIVSLIAGKIEGLDELGRRAANQNARFDYDAKISGLDAIGRYTVRIRLINPDPAFIYFLANPDLSIVPREAVEADGDEFALHPTGSGPYVVRDFQPGTRLVLERNPSYRMMHWEDVATSAPGDPEWANALRGHRFPLPDRVEWTAIPEAAAQMLAFERGEIDVVPAPVPAIENNRLIPRLATAGVKLARAPSTELEWLAFNLSDKQIGGAATEQIALRRAIAMAIDDEEYVRVIKNGSGHAVEYWIPEGIGGYDRTYRYTLRYDPTAANLLLDHFGYRKGSDGYRVTRDGTELTISLMVGTSARHRELSEFLKRSLDRIGIRLKVEPLAATQQEARQETCNFQINRQGWGFDWPDGSNLLLAFYGRSDRAVNQACMQDHDLDAMYETLITTPLGIERIPLYRRIFERLNALVPVRLLPIRDNMYLTAANLRGFLIHPALLALYPYVEIAPKSK